MITLMSVPSIKTEVDKDKKNYFDRLEDAVKNLKVPKGIKVYLDGSEVVIESYDKFFGGQIVMGINEKIIEDIKGQINNVIA